MYRRQNPRWMMTAVVLLTIGLAGCASGTAKKPEIERDATFSVRMAQSMAKAGRINEALATLDEAIEKEPENAGLHNYYGVVCFQAGRYDAAVTAFKRALEVDPYLTDAHNYLGAVYLEQNRMAEAEVELKAALSDPAYPTPEKVHLNLGLLYAAQGRDRESVESLRRSVGIDPQYFKAHYQLAAMLERLGKLVEAAQEYEVAEPAFLGSGEYWYRRGMTYHLLGQGQKALDSLQRVRSAAPGSESAARAEELLELLD